MLFDGQKIVITGGSSGIGLAIAKSVVARNGQVVLVGRNQDKLTQSASELGNLATTYALDVTEEKSVEKFFQSLGSFDHLVTAAAGTVRGKVTELDTTLARSMFESKYWGQYYCVKYGAPHIKITGSIVLFSGWISRKPAVGVSTLAAVDAAIEALARTLALELAPIRVNAITPGMIDTPLWGTRLTPEQQREHFDNIAKNLPVGRAGTANDIAHAVVFLLENGFTTGSVLDVDGGQR